MSKTTGLLLPNGARADVPLAQARRVWQVWLNLALYAAARGCGLSLQVGLDAVAIDTVPGRDDGEWWSVVVEIDGRAWGCGCRVLTVDLDAEPPPAPWERS